MLKFYRMVSHHTLKLAPNIFLLIIIFYHKSLVNKYKENISGLIWWNLENLLKEAFSSYSNGDEWPSIKYKKTRPRSKYTKKVRENAQNHLKRFKQVRNSSKLNHHVICRYHDLSRSFLGLTSWWLDILASTGPMIAQDAPLVPVGPKILTVKIFCVFDSFLEPILPICFS